MIVFSGRSPRAPRWPTTSKARASAQQAREYDPRDGEGLRGDHGAHPRRGSPASPCSSSPLHRSRRTDTSTCRPRDRSARCASSAPAPLAYLDISGSGAETIAHLRENGRIVVMLCAFDGPPRIVRFHGTGTVLRWDEPGFAEAAAPFEHLSIDEARRAVITVDVTRVSDSCGYGVPLMELRGAARAPRAVVGQEAARDGPGRLRGPQAHQERGLARRPAGRGLTACSSPPSRTSSPSSASCSSPCWWSCCCRRSSTPTGRRRWCSRVASRDRRGRRLPGAPQRPGHQLRQAVGPAGGQAAGHGGADLAGRPRQARGVGGDGHRLPRVRRHRPAPGRHRAGPGDRRERRREDQDASSRWRWSSS